MVAARAGVFLGGILFWLADGFGVALPCSFYLIWRCTGVFEPAFYAVEGFDSSQ